MNYDSLNTRWSKYKSCHFTLSTKILRVISIYNACTKSWFLSLHHHNFFLCIIIYLGYQTIEWIGKHFGCEVTGFRVCIGKKITWFVVSIDDYPYLDYHLSIVMMAPLCRFDLAGSELLDIELEAMLLIEKIIWGEFFRRFDWHNVEVTRQFSLSLKKNVAKIQNFHLVISKHFIAKEMKLPQMR